MSLKPGKEKPILQRHHWIYSGAVAKLPSLAEGEIAEVLSSKGEKLGLAMLNRGRSIVGHMLAFGNETLEEALPKRIAEAILLRRRWFNPAQTNAIRLINAEGDGIPGLIVDAYADVLIMQVSNPGMERLKPQIISHLIDQYKPRALFEKSTSFMRKKEGLQEVRALLHGESLQEVEIIENGLRYSVDLLDGQKTGLFLDQREMRSLVRYLSPGKRVLNCFAYTGGFSIAALAGGAAHVDSVEISAKCEPRLQKNLTLNHLAGHQFICADVFDHLKTTSWNYDLVILDPPAFVKKRDDIAKAFRAYKELNRHVLEKLPSGSLLLTCSCSYHVEESLFQNILFRAAHEAHRSVRILEKHRQAHDHPISIFHPESSYLKSFLLYVE
ncbi:MAG TPA: class I SAM-dependent rRNA methyltransferase [Chlamydiales bacterium]|nr:class I SAM-dependent rRNA methyltransferase [Chlamydiales bacterium]